MEMDLDIKVLGPGCRKCIEITNSIRQVIEENKMEVQIEQISNIDEIAEFGVSSTPAIVIGGDVKCVGRVPDRSEILSWLKRR